MHRRCCQTLRLGLLLCTLHTAWATQQHLGEGVSHTVTNTRKDAGLQQLKQTAAYLHPSQQDTEGAHESWTQQAWSRLAHWVVNPTHGWLVSTIHSMQARTQRQQYQQQQQLGTRSGDSDAQPVPTSEPQSTWAQQQQQQWQQDEHQHQQPAERHQASTLPTRAAGHQRASTEPEPSHSQDPGQQQAVQLEQGRLMSGRKLLSGIPLPHEWPGFLLPERERHLGVAHYGDWGRLRAALARHQSTGNLTIGVVGGSISAGAGALNSQSWVEWLEDWLGVQYNGSRDAWPGQPAVGDPRVRVANGAVPGTYSSYMSVCYNKHVPQDVDIVIVEYALNDEAGEDENSSRDRYDTLVRRAFERLLRKLMTFPNQPAVILLNAFSWFQVEQPHKHSGMYYTGADADFYEFASYYQLPMLSVKSAAYRLMTQGVPGFMVNRTRGATNGGIEPQEVDKDLRFNMFYWDVVHPNGETGHRVMSDLVVHLLEHVGKTLARRPWSDTEAARVSARSALPEPMIKGNWESTSDRCFVGDTFHTLVDPTPQQQEGRPGFEWLSDQANKHRPKFGYIANKTGATLRLKLDTRTAAHRKHQASVFKHLEPLGFVAVEIAYLQSYEGMGQASITCVRNCMCDRHILDGLDTERRVSLTALFEIKVSMHKECFLDITALGTTRSNSTTDQGTKVKITGVMISDEGADLSAVGKDLRDFRAMEFVMDGLRPNKSFEIQYTWR